MKKSSYTKLGREINDYLEKMRWSQRELARRTNISSSNISKLMRGKHTPTPETLTIIGNALGIDPMHLMRLADILPSSGQNGRNPAIEHIAQRLESLPSQAQAPTIEFIASQIDAVEAMYGEITAISKAKTYNTALDTAGSRRVIAEAIYEDDSEEVKKQKAEKIILLFGGFYPEKWSHAREEFGPPPKTEVEFA